MGRYRYCPYKEPAPGFWEGEDSSAQKVPAACISLFRGPRPAPWIACSERSDSSGHGMCLDYTFQIASLRPSTMNMPDAAISPLPHQQEGTSFLRDREAAALFDEQGLGKSRQLIDAICQDVETGVLDGALIVCPNSIKSTWGEEIVRHSNSRYAVFDSGRRARRLAFQSLKAIFYVINYEAVAAELPSLRALLRFKRMALVLDESHRIKTPEARVTRAIHSLRADAVRRYIMTGTPVANKPEDLWAQYFFLDDGTTLGRTFDAFRSQFCTSEGGYIHMDELRHRIAALSLRREKQGTIELPSKTVARVPVLLRGRQLRMYEEMRNQLALWIRDLSGEEILTRAENILTRLIRLPSSHRIRHSLTPVTMKSRKV